MTPIEKKRTDEVIMILLEVKQDLLVPVHQVLDPKEVNPQQRKITEAIKILELMKACT